MLRIQAVYAIGRLPRATCELVDYCLSGSIGERGLRGSSVPRFALPPVLRTVFVDRIISRLSLRSLLFNSPSLIVFFFGLYVMHIRECRNACLGQPSVPPSSRAGWKAKVTKARERKAIQRRADFEAAFLPVFRTGR